MSQRNAVSEKLQEEKSLGSKSLDAWRQEIDALDTELVRMLNQRAASPVKLRWSK